jgi:hypothetical protein
MKAKPPKTADIPDICSFRCPFSEFPPADSAGLCRTMCPVYCKKLKRLVNKNAPCEWKKGRED